MLNNFSEIEIIKDLLPKVLISTICGLIIGWERETKNKAAGIRTNVLISVGCCILTFVSVYIGKEYHNSDPSRIIGQIVTGIGFLGGGVIIVLKGRIIGVTTASFIWVMCSLGILSGLGFVLLPIILTFGLLGISLLLQSLERKIDKRTKKPE